MPVKWHGKQFMRKLDAAMVKGMDRIADEVVDAAQSSMEEPKTGVKYPSMIVQSSAPGEAPAAQGGRLRNSIHFMRTGKLDRLVGTKVPYGLYLEVGTKHMDARSWLRPAVLKITDHTGDAIFKDLIR